MSKAAFQQEEGSFSQQTGLKFQEETSKVPHLEHSCVVVILGQLGKVEQK